MATIMEHLTRGRVLFDGGMGSMLIARGLEAGRPPEEWNVSRPDVIGSVHRAYLDAGADVIQTNTFGGTAARLARHGFAERVGELNLAGIRLARSAIEASAAEDRSRFVAFSMGPSGEMMAPVGAADEAQVRTEFERQLQAVCAEPPDLVLVETMVDLREALIALDVAKRAVDVPVAVSMTYNYNPRGFFTVMGDEATVATAQLEAAGADVIGANCSITSRDMLDLAAILTESATVPVLCQPNAGEPTTRDGMPTYDGTPEEFAAHAAAMFGAGVSAVGGCCGTTPEFIRRAAVAALGGREGETAG